MAQKHDILYTEKPMTVGTHEQGPQKRYRRLRFPSFDADVWANKNPLLQKGELGHEKDTGRFKVGDGVTYWLDLPYNSVGDPAKVNGHNVLEIIAGKNVEIEQNGNVLTIGASGVGYSKQEIDNKFIVANAQIDANATAIVKTRDDMNAEDSRLQTQITAQAAEIATKQDKLTAGDNIVISGNVISATGAGGGAGFDMQVVDQLPATGKKGVIYLVPKDGAAPDVYDEYVWIDATQTFELIGSTKVDLSDYLPLSGGTLTGGLEFRYHATKNGLGFALNDSISFNALQLGIFANNGFSTYILVQQGTCLYTQRTIIPQT